MPTYFTPEELAQILKIKMEDVMTLISDGKLSAIRIGESIRISEAELDNLAVTCAAGPVSNAPTKEAETDDQALAPGQRWCATRSGRAKFRVSGSLASGASIWPGKMQSPIKFPKTFIDKMLAHFKVGEFAIGGKFDDPGKGSLGEFIQHELRIKMNPAVYMAALLIDEGYAESTSRGHIRLISNKTSAGAIRS